MLRSDFDYPLPAELIAQQPPAERGQSRLLCVDNDAEPSLCDRQFADLPDLLRAGDLLVFNDTRVIPARLFGHKASGGRVELLIERLIGDNQALTHIRASKSPREGSRITLDSGHQLTVSGRQDALYQVRFETDQPLAALLDEIGQLPLPPYITRTPERHDSERYQTVYARQPGAIAAPTAGLHFTQTLLDRLSAIGVEQGFVTLHVGAGTFQPVRCETITEHKIHAEWLSVGEALCRQIDATRRRGGRVIAVGTTVVRSLESACTDGVVRPFEGETRLFIYPGYRFGCIDAMITNFHLPQSTLLMLVSAFAGYQSVMTAYHHAIRQRYRFFSYGDAMWLTRNDAAQPTNC